MKTRLRSGLLAALSLVFAGAGSVASADPPTLISATIEPNTRELIVVTFSPAVSAADVLRSAWWAIELSTKTTIRDVAVQRVGIVTCSETVFEWMVNRCPNDEDAVEIALQMAAPAPEDVTRVDLRFTGPAGAARFGAAVADVDGDGSLVGAKADDADIGFKGSYTKTADQAGAYSIDAYAGYMRAIVRVSQATRQARYLGRVGVYGQSKTSKSASADPDSFLIYGVYQRELGGGGFKGPFQTPWLSLRAPGWEFDKERSQLNFVASPIVTFPVRLFGTGRLGAFEPGLTIPVLTLQAGAELIKPQRAALGTKDWHTRGVFGATLATGYAPERAWLHTLELTATYVVRALSDEEIYKDPRRAPIDPATGKKGDPVFELGSQKRDLASAELTYRPVKWVGLSFKYEYGSEPPAFELTDRTFTFGLAFALKQTSFGRYAILKP